MENANMSALDELNRNCSTPEFEFKKFCEFLDIAEEILDSDSSVDSECEYLLLATYKPKTYNDVEDLVAHLDNDEFKRRFKVKKTVFEELVNQFFYSNFCPKENTHGGRCPISPEKHILCFLWFAGNKSGIQDAAVRFGMGISSCHRAIDRVIQFLLEISPNVIKFPTSGNEKTAAVDAFRKISDFPGVIGCISRTSISIRTPAHKLKSFYANKDNVPTLTLQGVFDCEKRFIDIFTGVPSKIHDGQSYTLSFISKDLPEICSDGHYHVLGDTTYPIREWLLTPYVKSGRLSKQQRNFNNKLNSTRAQVGDAFAILIGRFRQLIQVDFHRLSKISNFITACCVVHNMCIDKEDDLEEYENIIKDDTNIFSEQSDNTLRKTGELKRDYICNKLYLS